jgi:peptidoglycan hydrolase-like protein with peptidoglycan-binding domain
MSPQRARTYGWLFMAMSVSVCANLLLFQSGKRVDVAGSGQVGNAMRVGAVQPSSPADAVTDTVRAVQRELKKLNLYPGQVDGKPSPLIHAAVVAYEQAQALPITGEPSQTLLRELIVGPSPAGPAGGARGGDVVQGTPADRLVRDLRRKLVALGYAPGHVEGRITVELMQAIRAFEKDSNLSQTGRISAHLLLQLQRSAAAFKPRAG